MEILKVENLSKSSSPLLYRIAKGLKIEALAQKLEGKVVQAVKGVSFEVNSGEICGFLGPNGAGKSTTIKAILGLIYKDTGKVSIIGESVENKQALNDIGAIIEFPALYNNLSARDNLKYYATLRGNVSKTRIEEVLKLVGLLEVADKKFAHYSTGMRQRLGIAQAIMHSPKLLILDEPANGLDPQGVIELRKLLDTLAHKEGMAILVSSHQLSEMQQMCDRVIIMNKGEIISIKRIEELLGSNLEKVQVILSVDNVELASKVIHEKYNSESTVDDKKISIKIEKEKVPELTKELLLSGVMVSGVQIKERTLEDLFVEMTSQEEKK